MKTSKMSPKKMTSKSNTLGIMKSCKVAPSRMAQRRMKPYRMTSNSMIHNSIIP